MEHDRIRILIFDFDGSIAKSKTVAITAYNKIARENGYVRVTEDNLRELEDMRPRQIISTLKVPMFQVPFVVKGVISALGQEKIPVVDGIKEALETLAKSGCELQIVCSNSVKNVTKILEDNGIRMFKKIHHVVRLFGKHRKIIQLIKKNGWHKSEVIYIGDEIRDIETARRAGVLSAAVIWGYQSEKALLENAPDFLIRTPRDLTRLSS